MKMSSRAGYLWALLSGVFLALSFPIPGLSILAWCAFVPLFKATDGAAPGKAFNLAFTAGLAGYAGMLYWVNIVMTTYGKLPLSVSFALYMFLCAYLALYPAVTLWLVRRGENAGISALVSFPVIWTGLEFVRSFLLTGFPWESLGYSQYRTLPLIQIADLTGVYGLSFLIALANVVIFRVLLSVSRKGATYPVRGLIALLVLMALTVAYGFGVLSRPESGPEQQVLLVQGNIPQDVKWDPAFQESTVATYERLTRLGCREPGTLVVWPESALPFFFQAEPVYAARVRALAAELKSPLLTGSPAVEKEDGLVRYLNSAYLISPQGAVVGRSDKLHLVPFGEYVPLAKLLPFVNKMVAGIGDFSPGKSAVPLQTDGARLGVLVCFEGIFPEVARSYVAAGANVLVNITNDAWFGRSSAPYQHLSMMVFRAVENRVPLVRAANTGITSAIDSRGHIDGMTPLFEEATLAAKVHPGKGGTFYNRFGDVFAILCLCGAAVCAGYPLKTSAKGKTKKK
ncbi:apolipoprotein N-acyltransferase [Geomesophilobacter sediminis]|uniref:Apolipoprotein N-acyltransferase n=1 Tax=Geomesophilobacter sediminis TaxID=2798584 RepID=A0A8J7M1T5_9BACT|nr:apolipoprotein N-acyltransferase [Geomesophilobacter sediminis]MBJ6726943.1 apolipoprotein N-acyltransferase [Geomesophilobacter sediminis]